MGRFFSSVQIKNNGSREQFVKSFCNLMKKRGLAACSEDEASVSYILAFSESGKWVTLTSEKYGDAPNRVKTDARQTAAEMKTSSFCMEVVDSDFALLQLYKNSSAADTVIVGDGSGYGFDGDDSKKGKRECWEELLAPGKTWEQLSEKWNKDEVFVEDALYEAASVLGIEPKYMVSDHEDLSGMADKDTNVVPMFFKKKITVSEGGEKKLTMNAGFKKVFGEALEPLGFVKAKTKYPYYVRVLNGEVVQVVAVKEEFSNTFDIVSGIATVYRVKIDLSQSVKYNTNWLKTIANYYSCLKYYDTDYDDDYRRRMMFFNFNLTTNDDKINIFNYALEQFKMWVLPTFNKINSVKIAYENFQKRYFGVISTKLYDDYENTKTMNEDESLTLFSFDEPYEIIDKMFKKSMAQIDFVFKHNKEGYGEEYFEARYKNSMLFEKSQKETLNKILNCDEIYQRILDERERRKKANIERLRSYGIMI